jgi:hypothetical protein
MEFVDKNDLSRLNQIFLVEYITEVIDDLIDLHKNEFSNGVYKVRTKYSESKFYLNKVDGSDEESLRLLIHKIMERESKYVDSSNDPDERMGNYYEMFLSYEHREYIFDDHPSDELWWVDKDHKDYEELDEFLSDVYYKVIHNTYEKLKLEGYDLKDDFKDYLDL